MRFDKSDKPEPTPGPKAIRARSVLKGGVPMRHPLHNLTADIDPDPANIANAEAQGWRRLE
jgi:hypothetical protein